MRTAAQVPAETVKVLSQLTGQALDAKDIVPPVPFLAALITILWGVIIVDQQVTQEENRRGQEIIKSFVPTGSGVHQLAQLLDKGIREQKVYADFNIILTLLKSFSEPEKLLLIGLGYELSSVDGAIADSEKKYLRYIGSLAQLNPQHVEVLETAFTQQPICDFSALTEVKALLDPARFHELDTLFINAASNLLAVLPSQVEEPLVGESAPYEHLQFFQTLRKQLDSICFQLYKITQECTDRNLLPPKFIEDVAQISRRLQSQRFRVTVVGEFSQGKSTLLNALLGEEIQPVRAIPCSRTITVLRHGSEKRVICYYRDGREEEISVEQYKEIASIPKGAAVEHRYHELAASKIEEIIFEHPGLDLCKEGVEILDSPGLNENPNRTSITKKILKDTDAVIFLTNATRLLSESEKELLQYVRNQITSDTNQPFADNLFLLVNFMDLIDNDEDREDIKQRLEEFIISSNLLPDRKRRVHYISAKSALKKHSEYVRSFNLFTQELEQYLTHERGTLEIQAFIDRIKDLMQVVRLELERFGNLLDEDKLLSEAEIQQVLEQIGELTGWAVRIQQSKEKALAVLQEQRQTSWNTWLGGLRNRLTEKSKRWKSEHSAFWSRDKLLFDYSRQFTDDLSEELNTWLSELLKPSLDVFDREIQKSLGAIQAGINRIPVLQQSQLSKWVLNKEQELKGFYFLELLGNALLGAFFLPAAIFNIIFAGEQSAKGEVIENGYKQFTQSLNKTLKGIDATIDSEFSERITQVQEVIADSIWLYENLLEQQDTVHQQSLKQQEIEKSWIAEKHLELENLQSQIETTFAELDRRVPVKP